MSVTYDFILELAQAWRPAPARLLDFGCGAGQVVTKALALGYDACGVDRFAGPWAPFYDQASRLADRIKRIAPGQPLPFGDATFDVILTNQVFEHIAEPAPVIAELSRVLRPGGVFIAIFPTREIIREPHLKAPFVHRLPNGSAAQRMALSLCHRLRLCNRPDTARASWVAEEMQNLQAEIFYKSESQALAMFEPYFRLAARGEGAFMRDRLRRAPRLRALANLPEWCGPVLQFLCVRAANIVLVMRRRE